MRVLRVHEENGGGPLGAREQHDLAAHRPRLVRCAQRVLKDSVEAEDVAQEAIQRGLQAELREPRALGAWLLATCTRIAIDRLRKRGRHDRALARAAQPAAPRDPSQTVVGKAESDRAQNALQGLRDPYRRALRLRYLDELSVDEIAAKLDAKPRTVRTWLGRGLSQLRAELGDA